MPKSFRSLGVMPLIAILALGWPDASVFAEIELILHDEDGTVYVAEIVYLEAVDLDPGDPWVNIVWYSRPCGGAWNHHTDIDNMNCVAAWVNGAYSGDFKCRVFHESGAISEDTVSVDPSTEFTATVRAGDLGVNIPISPPAPSSHTLHFEVRNAAGGIFESADVVATAQERIVRYPPWHGLTSPVDSGWVPPSPDANFLTLPDSMCSFLNDLRQVLNLN